MQSNTKFNVQILNGRINSVRTQETVIETFRKLTAVGTILCELCRRVISSEKQLSWHYECKQRVKIKEQDRARSKNENIPLSVGSKPGVTITEFVEDERIFTNETVDNKTFSKYKEDRIKYQRLLKNSSMKKRVSDSYTSCQLCDYQATDESSLATHILSIHDGVDSICGKCGHQATNKTSLAVHLQACGSVKTYEKGSRYNCIKCDKPFKSEKTMIDHIKSKICQKERLLKTYERLKCSLQTET